MKLKGLAASAVPAIVWPFKNLCLTMIFLCTALAAYAAPPLKVWNGSASTNWATPANWTPAAVPIVGDSVRIPSEPTNQPVILSGTIAKAKNVLVLSGATLTVNAGGEMELTSSFNASGLILDGGTVVNSGLIKVKSGFQGITNSGNFTNNGTIWLGEATSNPYSFREDGIQVSGAGDVFTNNSTGNIIILRPGNNGVLLFLDGGNFTNYGKITVRDAGLNPSTAATADGIDARDGDFVNETTGDIVISKITANGLNCRRTGSWTNKGSVKIGNVGLTVALDFREGISNSAIFTNTSTGQITIDTCSNSGILNQGTFNNSGTIAVGEAKTNSINNNALGNLGMFNNYSGATLRLKNAKRGILSGGLGGLVTNYSGGTISIGQVSEDGIYQFGLGGTDNRGILNIGSTGAISGHAINNACQFLNQFGAEVNITSTADTAIVNTTVTGLDGLFKNIGKISIDNSANGSKPAIRNTANCTFENLFCPALVHISSNNPIHNTGTFTNEGNIIENASDNSSITTNSGTIQNLNGGTFSVTGSNTGLVSTATGAIWTGCDDTNWANELNWNDLAEPVASDDVYIIDRTNDPVILSGTAAVAKSVTVNYGAVLSVNASSNLTISGSTTTGLHNAGTVNNAGTLSISNTGGIGLYCIASLFSTGDAMTGLVFYYDGGFFNNNSGGLLTINNTTDEGIFQVNTSLNNYAEIKIGSTGSIGKEGIESRGSQLDNKAGGEITVDRTVGDGIFIFSNSMTNAGKITIGGIAGTTIGRTGIANGATITNNAGGEIKIDRTTQEGVSNSFSNFNNYGMLKIGGVAAIGSWGISNQNGNFNNYSTGEIAIDRTGQNGIYNYYNVNNRAFGNSGKIFIGKTVTITGHGILNEGIFNNNSDGELTIDRTSSDGIYVRDDNDSNTRPAAFNNSGKLTIGGTATIGDNGIRNRVTFNNNAGGDLKIDRTTGDGLQNFQGNFNNAAKITIGATVAPTGDGLDNAATFNNQACGEIALHDNLNNSGTFTNAGLLRMNTALTHTNSGSFTNNGIIAYPQGSLIPGVTNNDVIVKAVSGECPVANALDLGGNNSFTIGTTWYKNANLTMSAGTYNQAANTFTTSGLADGSTTTLYFTVSDATNCTRTVSLDLTYNDITPPTIQCPANQTVAANGNCAGVVGTWSLVSKMDNCAATISENQWTASSTPLSGHNDVKTVFFTANDGNGNSTGCSFTVTLKDVTQPSISCPANATVAANANCQSAIGSYTSVSKSDNCATTISEMQSPASSTILTGHNTTQTVTLTANDGNGNTSTCTLIVTLKDIAPPSISCPPSLTLNANANCQEQVGSYSAATLSDNCNPVPNVMQSPAASTTLSGHNDVETVTLTADDGNGNTATCTLMVTLKDVTVPGITCPANRTVNTDAEQCSSEQTYLVTASDNCTYTLTRTNGLASGSAFPLGLNVVNWQVTDAGGNSTACSFSITVVDNQAPIISCPNNRTVNADANLCSSLQTYTVTASDNCSYTLTRTNGFASGTAFPLGLNVVNWQVTDAGGNSTVCSFSITVVDAQTPTITCPSSSTVNATTGLCAAAVNYTVSGNDNCSGWSLSRTSGLQSGALFPVGVTTVNWKNTDTGGNSTTCSFSVTVTDGQLPGITCPANITANAAVGSCAATVNYTTPTVSDNCSGASAMHVSGGTSGSSFNKGINTVQWKATDGANNTKTCSFSITVNDNQAPTITCPANITANTGANNCAATVTFGNATATDNCTPPPTVIQSSGQASGSSFARGQHTIAFRATDGVGLTKTCSFRITVVDNVLPTITCPSNIVKITDNNLCSAVTNYTVTGADNCTSVSVSRASGLASGSAFPKGTNTVVWRATDLAGNSTLCSFTVTVNDTQLPGITCPASISTNTTPGQCSKVVNYTTPTYSDNCAGGSISLFSGLASGSVFPTGVSTVIWRAFDNSANSADCAFTITVTDNVLPVITCPPAATVAGGGSPCGFPSAQLSTPSASDNCAVTSLASDAPASLPAGPTTVTWTAGDAAGNLKTCAYVVTVNCGANAGARDEVGSMKDEDRYEVGGMKDEARTSLHSLIPHYSSLIPHHLSLSPNPASDIVVVTLSNQQINNKSNQHHSASNQQINNTSNQQLVIHDALGRQVWAMKLEAGVEQVKIDLALGVFEDGLYQLSWLTENGIITKTLVVARN